MTNQNSFLREFFWVIFFYNSWIPPNRKINGILLRAFLRTDVLLISRANFWNFLNILKIITTNSTSLHQLHFINFTSSTSLKTEEKTKAETATALQSEADRVLAELEGDPDEPEDNLTQLISINFVIFELFLLTTLIPALFLLL